MANADKIMAAARAVLEGRPPIPRRAVAALHNTTVLPSQGGDGQPKPSAPMAVPASAPKPVTETPKPATPTPQAAVTTEAGVPVIMPNMDLIITEATVVV